MFSRSFGQVKIQYLYTLSEISISPFSLGAAFALGHLLLLNLLVTQQPITEEHWQADFLQEQWEQNVIFHALLPHAFRVLLYETHSSHTGFLHFFWKLSGCVLILLVWFCSFSLAPFKSRWELSYISNNVNHIQLCHLWALAGQSRARKSMRSFIPHLLLSCRQAASKDLSSVSPTTGGFDIYPQPVELSETRNTDTKHTSPTQTYHKPRQACAPSVPYEDARAGLKGQRLRAPGEGDSVVLLAVHVQTHLSVKGTCTYVSSTFVLWNQGCVMFQLAVRSWKATLYIFTPSTWHPPLPPVQSGWTSPIFLSGLPFWRKLLPGFPLWFLGRCSRRWPSGNHPLPRTMLHPSVQSREKKNIYLLIEKFTKYEKQEVDITYLLVGICNGKQHPTMTCGGLSCDRDSKVIEERVGDKRLGEAANVGVRAEAVRRVTLKTGNKGDWRRKGNADQLSQDQDPRRAAVCRETNTVETI